jgi:hypothetical protein
MPRRVFRCADARAVARGGFRVFAKKQGNTGDHGHAVSERRKRRLKPVIKHQPIAVELPPIETAADSVEAAARIAAAVAAGELTATEAAELAKVIDTYVGALATRGFDERLTKLEQGISGAPAVPARGAVRDDATV